MNSRTIRKQQLPTATTVVDEHPRSCKENLSRVIFHTGKTTGRVIMRYGMPFKNHKS